MKFVIVDNDKQRSSALRETLQSKFPDCTVTEFADALLSAKYICNHDVDVVLVQEIMPRATGDELQHVIAVNKPNVRVKVLRNTEKMPNCRCFLLAPDYLAL